MQATLGVGELNLLFFRTETEGFGNFIDVFLIVFMGKSMTLMIRDDDANAIFCEGLGHFDVT